MERTSDILIKCASLDEYPPMSVIVDYFGFDNLNKQENITIIYALYQGLINNDLVTSKELHTNCKNNSLDDLIRRKYEYLKINGRTSEYYKEFCKNHLKINTKLSDEPE